MMYYLDVSGKASRRVRDAIGGERSRSLRASREKSGRERRVKRRLRKTVQTELQSTKRWGDGMMVVVIVSNPLAKIRRAAGGCPLTPVTAAKQAVEIGSARCVTVRL